MVEQATKLVNAGVVGIVGSPQSGTTATVQNLLQRSTSIAQLGEWHWVVTVVHGFNCLFGCVFDRERASIVEFAAEISSCQHDR